MPYTFDTTGTEVAADLSSHIAGKIVLTTGVSPNGLGAQFLTTIAVHKPRLLILAGRSLDKAKETAEAIKAVASDVETRLLELDLASLASVRKAADEVLAYPEEAIDVLVLNAGIMAPPYSTTAEGLESQFGANHIAHFLFTNLVMPKVLKAKNGGRVVSVTSVGHRLSPVRFDDLGFAEGKHYHPWRGYGQTKTANMLFAISLAEKLGQKGLQAFSVHPGGIQTNLSANSDSDFDSLVALERQQGSEGAWIDWSNFRFKTLDQGVATHVRAAFEPNLKEYNGRYLEDSEITPKERIRAWARDEIEAERLWKVSEEIVGQNFAY
ncbi:hypothetical protein MMC10_000909 [Thelotrema lepadinum]|nr:hypothetical protein [Thelotrema lepadinum]